MWIKAQSTFQLIGGGKISRPAEGHDNGAASKTSKLLVESTRVKGHMVQGNVCPGVAPSPFDQHGWLKQRVVVMVVVWVRQGRNRFKDEGFAQRRKRKQHHSGEFGEIEIFLFKKANWAKSEKRVFITTYTCACDIQLLPSLFNDIQK